MNETLKKFLEEASKNEELNAKLATLTNKDTDAAKAIEIAKEYGFTLTVDDLQGKEGEELSLNELENVAGGGFFDCFFSGVSKVQVPVDPTMKTDPSYDDAAVRVDIK